MDETMAFDGVDSAGDHRQGHKRRRQCVGEDYQNHNAVPRNSFFLPLAPNPYIFACNDCPTDRSYVYSPLVDERLVNVRKFDQITFSSAGQHFIADDSGEYSGSRTGRVVHFWRYDKSRRESYVSLSLLIVDTHVFNAIKDFIEHI